MYHQPALPWIVMFAEPGRSAIQNTPFFLWCLSWQVAIRFLLTIEWPRFSVGSQFGLALSMRAAGFPVRK